MSTRTAETLVPVMYDELRKLADQYLARERRGHTLQATALVHEAYLRLTSSAHGWSTRATFLAAAANVFRRILVDHARKRRAARRKHVQAIDPLSALECAAAPSQDLSLELSDALDRLFDVDPRRARVAELRLFAGLTNAEIATVLGVARSTVADDWLAARAWLSRLLSEVTPCNP
jgi:RNA polymerase sigma factor (TIGR02999 family)